MWRSRERERGGGGVKGIWTPLHIALHRYMFYQIRGIAPFPIISLTPVVEQEEHVPFSKI